MIRRLDAIASGGATTVTATVEAYSGATATGRLAARPVCAAAMIAADMIAFGASALAAWLISTSGVLAPMTGGAFPAASPEALRSALAPAFILGGLLAYFLAKGHYSRRLPFWWELQQVLIGSIFALLCSSFVEFTFKTDVSRVVVFCIWVLFPLALVAMRHTARHLLSEANLWQIRTVIVGHGAAADRAAEALTSEHDLGYAVIGIISPAVVSGLSTTKPWTRLVQQFRADLVVIAPEADETLDRDRNETLVRERVPFAVMPHAEGLPVSGCVQTYFFRHDLVMLSYRNNLSQPLARTVKLALDAAGAAMILLAISPVLLAVALLVKLDGGPVLFSHVRIGAGGRRFNCLKFRSMRTNSAEVLDHLLSTNPAAAVEWAATQKLRNDPRVTRIGAWLRKTSLDELPQLLNVLRLEMSLVGPRPIVEAELPHYGENITYYYETRPGLTGLWQVSGRSDTTYQQRVQLDTWYVKNWTLWHDIAILAKTVPAVLDRTGAR
ncbi:MAG TPA: undecaprenyl-phosphate galactose phosphotransferase WbaP [Acetobacteraceae bacterium]